MGVGGLCRWWKKCIRVCVGGGWPCVRAYVCSLHHQQLGGQTSSYRQKRRRRLQSNGRHLSACAVSNNIRQSCKCVRIVIKPIVQLRVGRHTHPCPHQLYQRHHHHHHHHHHHYYRHRHHGITITTLTLTLILIITTTTTIAASIPSPSTSSPTPSPSPPHLWFAQGSTDE